MSYLQRKKFAFMAIVNRIKGFVRSAVGIFSLNLSDCVDRSSLINLSVSGNTAQSGTPSPDNPVEVEGVGDKSINLFDLDNAILTGAVKENGVITSTASESRIDILLPAGTYSISLKKSSDFKVYMVDGRVPTGNYIVTMQATSSFISFDYTATTDGYLRIKWFLKGNSISEIMLVKGSYTEKTMPEYEPYGKYKLPVNCTGINMCDFSKFYVPIKDYATIDKTNETITIPINNGNSRAVYQNEYQPITSGQYTLALKSTGYPIRAIVGIYDINKTLITTTSSIERTAGTTSMDLVIGYVASYQGFYMSSHSGVFNFTIKNNSAAYIKIGFTGLRDTAWEDGQPRTISEIILLKGTYTASTLPDYEEYRTPVNGNIYLDRPLYKIVDYADKLIINYDNRTAKRINNIKAVDMSSLNWTYQQNKYMYAHISDGKTKNELNGYAGYSNYYPLSTVNWDLTPDKSMQLPSNLNSTVRNVLIYDSDYTDAEDFIAYLKTLENPTIYYILTEPEEESVQLDWNALPNTVKGTTIITAESTVLPTEMSAEYFAKTQTE